MATPATLPAEFFDSQKQFPETLPAEFFDDPLNAQPKRAEDLPTQQQFDESHANAVRNVHGTARTLAERRASIAAEPPVTFQDFKQAATSPTIPISKLAPDQPTSVAGGVAKGVAQFAEGMTSPMNAALMALPALKIGPYLPRAISAVFGADMLHSAYKQIPEVKAAVDKQDWPAAAAAITKAGLTAGAGVAAGAHAVRGEASAAPTAGDALESARAGAEAIAPDHLPADFFEENAAPNPARLPADFDFEKGLKSPNRRVSGSLNIPLNDQGRQEMADLAQKTAGQLTRIEHAPNDRAAESASILSQSNPQAVVTPAEGLKPWALGEHEGQPVETEKAAIDERIRDTPDEAPPGGHEQSTAEGEPFNAAKDRTVQHFQGQLQSLQPDEKVLNIGSGRTLRIVDSYLKNGAPADGTVDPKAMTRAGDGSETGDLFRATPVGLKAADNAEQPGIYYARHGATDFNGEPKAENTPGVRPESSAAKPLWEMSPDELSAVEGKAKTRDRDDLVDAFGADGAQRYKRLERAANSTSRSHAETSKAQDELERMEASLSEQQRHRLYGIGDDRPQSDDIREYRQALGRLDWDSPEALGESLKWAVTGVGAKDNPADMTQAERIRYAQLRYAMSEAANRGWDAEAISNAALRGAAGRFDQNRGPGETHSDAEFMLRRFARPGGGRAIEQPDTEAPKQRFPQILPAVGRETSIAIPGETTKYPARYAIRELADVQASHNPHSFEANPDYEHTNDRDYSRSGNAARVVQQSAKGTFDPTFLTTDSPTAEHGTPIIDSNGNALGGNSRTMTLARVYQRGGADAALYPAEIRAKAAQFGIDPAEIDRFKNPVLVRELADRVEAQKAITDFNKSAAAELTPEERAVSDGRRLSPETVTKIAAKLEDVGEESTLAQALRGDDGADILNALVKDGVLTEQEKGAYLDDRDSLTMEAKGRIAKALVGRLFDSPAEFRETTPSMRGKLERVAPQLLRVEGREGWALTDQVREGIALLEDARIHRQSIDEAARQTTVDGRKYSPESVVIAKTLERGPAQAAGAFRRYANDEALSREGSQSSFFTPPSRQEAFGDAFTRARSASVTLGGGLGAFQEPYEKFFEQDLKPAAKRVAADLVEAKDQVLKVVAPQLRGEAAELMGLSLRQRMAQFARRFDQGEMRLRDAERFFNQRTASENYKFIDDIEHGRSTGNSDMDAIAGVFRKMLDQRRTEVQALGEGALERFYTHYFPHIFERTQQAEGFVKSFFGQRTFEGAKSFLKRREFPTFKEAIEAGQKPVSDNPVRLVLMKAREMDRYLLAHNVLRDMAERGIAKRLMLSAAAGAVDQEELFEGKPLKPNWLVPTQAQLPPDFKQIADPVGGRKWYAQEGAADVLNNYLTPGLRAKSGMYRILVGVNNTMNQGNLGLSAFHLTGEIIRSGVSRAALGIEDLLQGKPVRGLLRITTFLAGPFMDMIEGSKVLHDWFKPGSEGAPIAAITDALTKGGGRVGQPAEYSNQMVARMQHAFRGGNYVGGILRAPFALLEQTAKPMMEYMIPRLKLGVFHGMAANELERLGPGATVEQTRAAMASVWDSVDNRMGQLIYDNLFWHRTFKDLAHLMVRSVGWNLGTLREVGGGVKDIANLARGQKPEFNHRMAYTLALPLVSGMIGAMYQYAHTGQGPEKLKDYFFPKREDGSRIALPTDVKDVYHYATAPVRTIENKTGPLVNTLVEMLHNRDYYDRPIRGEGDPLIQQLKEEADFIGRQFLPFTLQPSAGGKKRAIPEPNPVHKVENFLGFTKAPSDIQDNTKQRKAPKSLY